MVFSPDYSYLSLYSESSEQANVNSRGTLEIPTFGFTTGWSFLFRPSKCFSLETVVLFSDKGEKTVLMNIFDDAVGFELAFNESIVHNHYYYIDISIKLRYEIFQARVSMFATVGFSTNVFLQRKIKINHPSLEVSTIRYDKEVLSSVNFAGLISIGLYYEINEDLNLIIEPIFRHSITPITNTPIKQYQYSLGVNMGIFYRF